LLPQPPSASPAPTQPEASVETDAVAEAAVSDREIDDLHEAREGFASLEADDTDVEAALSVPPPLVSPRGARRAAIAVGVLLAVVVAWAGARKLRRPSAVPPIDSAPLLALSPEPQPAPLASADDPDLLADEAEQLPFDEAKGLALRKEARAMLEAGRIDEGVATARRAIEANPNDPENYILLAAGLQDQGKWNEARQIFGKCVRQSTRAEKAECVYFATRGK
jgi:tetratricopeptide (TPR) repeat protein